MRRFYALFMVGPTAMLIEIWMDSRRENSREAGGGALMRITKRNCRVMRRFPADVVCCAWLLILVRLQTEFLARA